MNQILISFFLYDKDPFEAKYQLQINKKESTGLKYLFDSKAFIEYSKDLHDIYKNIKEKNRNKNRNVLIVFDMTADMLSNKKLNPIVTELFIRQRKLNIYLVFIKQPYFTVPKNVRLHSTHYFVMKISNKQLQQIAFNHSSDNDLQDVMNLYQKCTAKPYFWKVHKSI